MQTPDLRTRSERFALLRDAALANPAATGGKAVALQIGLIVLAHATTFVATALAMGAVYERAGAFWNGLGLEKHYVTSEGPTFSPGAVAGILLVSLVTAIIQGTLAWLPFRIPTRRQRVPLTLFVRSWWRTCAWGMLMIPTAAVVVVVAPQVPPFAFAASLVAPCLLILYAILGPAYFARLESRPDRRQLPRWRPVCPECGYSLRTLRGDRCPECGVLFPTKQRTFRRWAVRRLVWERAERGNFAIAYIKTLLMVVFRPKRAARGVAVPDRLGGASRWALAHVVLLAAAVGVGSTFQWLRAAFGPVTWWSWPAEQMPAWSTMFAWGSQSLAAWLIALVSLPLLAIGLSVAFPACHPAAARGMIKWALYCTPIVALVFAGGYAYSAWRYVWFGPSWSGIWAYMPANPLVVFVALVYGFWWASGVSANPYLQRRGLRVFIIHFTVFVLSWLVLTSLLFPPGALTELL